MLGVQGQQEYVKQIKSSPGLYFDYLGKLKIKNGQLDVLIPIDISHLKPHIENIKSALSSTINLCIQTETVDSSECHNVINPLIIMFNDTMQKYTSISHLVDNRNRRNALIGGIGSAFKYIFGTLDENDGIRYNEAIEAVENDQDKLATLIKQNILVTTSVISAFNNTLTKIKSNEANLNVAIENLSIGLKNVSIQTNELLIQSYQNQILNSLEAAILAVSLQVEDIVDAILFCNQNILHPSMLSPQQLYIELTNNIRHLPDNLKLPVILDFNTIHFVLSISKLICYYVNKKIVFVLQIPLVSPDEFMLYHNIALPTPHDSNKPNTFSLILPDSKFIAMTKDKLQFCNLDSIENCKTTTSNNYICDVTNVYASDAKPTCASELMSKIVNKIPTQCKTNFIYGKLDVWKPISNNRWIYVQTEPNKISIDCINNKLYENSIIGTGTITIPRGCIAYCRSTTLLPKNNVINITSPIQITDFNLIDDTCCNLVKFNEKINNVPPVELTNIDLDNLDLQKKILIDSTSDLNKISNKPHIVQYGTHYSTLVLIISFIIVFYIIYKICKCIPGSSSRFKIFKIKSLSPDNSDNLQTDTQDSNSETIPLPTIRSRI